MTSTPSAGGDDPDRLADVLGDDVAAELREWADTSLRKRARLSEPPWVRRGHTGAVLVVVEFVPDSTDVDFRLPEQRLITKVYPHGDLAGETGRHHQAFEIDPEFAERHLVRQEYSRYRMANGRHLAFQEIAFDLSEAYPLSAIAPEHQPTVAAHIADLVLVTWNRTATSCCTHTSPARQYLLDELRGALDGTHETRAWADRVGLLDPSARWIAIDGDDSPLPLPNPVAMAVDPSLLGGIDLTYLVGLSHGDLHTDNILARVSQHGALHVDDTRLIDLATFEPRASLSRDIATLVLSLLSEVVRTPLRPGEDTKLIDLVLTPENETITPQVAPAVVAAVRGVYSAFRHIVPAYQHSWRPQYLLSVVAQALIHTSYTNAGPDGRWWYLRLAAHAANRFLADRAGHQRPDPTATGRIARPGPALVELAPAVDGIPRARSRDTGEVPVIGSPAAAREDFRAARPDAGHPSEQVLGERVTDLTDRLIEAVERAVAAASADEMARLSHRPLRIVTRLSELLGSVAVPVLEPRDSLGWRMELRNQYHLTRSGLDRLNRLLPRTRADARMRAVHADQLIEAAHAIRGQVVVLLDLLDQSPAGG
ncbi:hypothetical protein [Micromonospora sp. NPDC023888]|uniref:hypothetical protein n=1 Tax=Micromonospora sp. NPDC023888 TaxID=3155607 RepID=UPI0033E9F129